MKKRHLNNFVSHVLLEGQAVVAIALLEFVTQAEGAVAVSEIIREAVVAVVLSG